MKIKVISVLVLLGMVFGSVPVFFPSPVAANEDVGWYEEFSVTTNNVSYYGHNRKDYSDTLYHVIHTWPAGPDSYHYFYNNDEHELTNPLCFSWGCCTDQVKIGSLQRSVFSWDTSAIEPDMEVVSGRVKIKFNTAGYTENCKYAVQLYNHQGGSLYPHEFEDYTAGEWGGILAIRQSGLFDKIEADIAASDYTVFELTEFGLAYINRGGTTQMWLKFVLDGEDLYGMEVVSGGSTSYDYYKETFEPVLELEYIAEPSDREVEEEENDDEGGSGNSTTGVSWLTPRCAFSDEKVGFRIEGDAGTEFVANLVGSDGMIANVGDSIRVNGYFYWYPFLNAYDGWIRCEVEVFDVNSTYGWSKHYVEAGNCRSYAKYLEDEDVSWVREVKDYQTSDYDEVLEWYWITGLESDELSDVTLTLRQGGARSNDIYEDTLDDIVVDYMECVDSNNYDLIASRYILGAMGGVVDDLDGLILDFDNPFVSLAKGYYYARIYRPDYGILKPVSAWWYCEANEFIVAEDDDCRDAEYFNVLIHNDVELNFDDRFKDASLCILGGGYTCEEGIIDEVDYNIQLDYALPEADVLLEISTTVDEYVHRSLFSTSGDDGGDDGGGGVPPIPDVLPADVAAVIEWLDDLFDTAGGRWLIMLGLMLLAALVFYKKHPKVVLIVCLGILGFGIAAGWVDVWVTVLLGIGGGLYLWHKVGGSKKQGE